MSEYVVLRFRGICKLCLFGLCSEVRSVVGPPPHQNANELKRPSSSSLLAQDMQYPHKMRCDSQNIPSLDELAHPLGSKPESISDKRDKSVSDPMQKVKWNKQLWLLNFLLN